MTDDIETLREYIINSDPGCFAPAKNDFRCSALAAIERLEKNLRFLTRWKEAVESRPDFEKLLEEVAIERDSLRAALDQLEKELTERPWIEKQRGDIMRNLEIKAFGWKCEANRQTELRIRAESERDALRAKLKMAEEALEPFAKAHIDGIYSFPKEAFRKARAIYKALKDFT